MNVSPIDTTPLFFEEPKQPPSFRALVDKITSIVLKTLNVITSVVCYYINPMLFCTGFVSGVLLDRQVRNINSKLARTWHEQNFPTKFLIFFCGALTLPFTITFMTIAKGAHLGTLMTPKSSPKPVEAYKA